MQTDTVISLFATLENADRAERRAQRARNSRDATKQAKIWERTFEQIQRVPAQSPQGAACQLGLVADLIDGSDVGIPADVSLVICGLLRRISDACRLATHQDGDIASLGAIRDCLNRGDEAGRHFGRIVGLALAGLERLEVAAA